MEGCNQERRGLFDGLSHFDGRFHLWLQAGFPIEQDVGDAQPRQRLAMAGLAPIANLGLVAENDDLLAADVLDDFGAHDRAFDAGRANARLIAIAGHQEHPAEIEALARLTRQSLDGDRIPRLDAVLFTACLDNGVHTFPTPTLSDWLTASSCRA